MAKSFIFVLSFLVCMNAAGPSFAQENTDQEMESRCADCMKMPGLAVGKCLKAHGCGN